MADIVITEEAAKVAKEACYQIDILLNMLTDALAGYPHASHAIAVNVRVKQLTDAVNDVIDGEEAAAKNAVYGTGVKLVE